MRHFLSHTVSLGVGKEVAEEYYESMENQYDFSSGGGKVFIEGFHARIINGLLQIVLTSGEDEFAFTLPLDLTKKLSRGLAAQVEEIEKKNNITIDGRLPNEPMVSPIQAKTVDGEAPEQK